MSEALARRYRVRFAKTEEMRYTGHLDVLRAWERLLRRAGVTLAFTQGFHPRPRFSVAAALPLGFLGTRELLDVHLAESLRTDELLHRLAASAPPGLRVDDVELVRDGEPTLPSRMRSADYEVCPEEMSEARPLAPAVEKLLAAREIPRERRGRSYDLRPLVESLDADLGGTRLRMRLAAREGATGRPDEVLAALGLDPMDMRVTRTRLVLAPISGG